MFWSLKRSMTLPSSKASGGPTFTLLGGSERTFGNIKRRVPRVMPAIAAVNAVQASPNQVPNMAVNAPLMTMKPRRYGPAVLAAGAAGLAGIGGLGGGGGAGLAGAAAAGTDVAAAAPSGVFAGSDILCSVPLASEFRGMYRVLRPRRGVVNRPSRQLCDFRKKSAGSQFE